MLRRLVGVKMGDLQTYLHGDIVGILKKPNLPMLNDLVREAYQICLGLDKPSVNPNEILDNGLDLRKIIKREKVEGVTGYQCLKKAGIVVSDFG
ncbi:hypothetical protein D9M71_719340 [compost metagenome]